jgi:hypothetical protein
MELDNDIKNYVNDPVRQMLYLITNRKKHVDKNTNDDFCEQDKEILMKFVINVLIFFFFKFQYYKKIIYRLDN